MLIKKAFKDFVLLALYILIALSIFGFKNRTVTIDTINGKVSVPEHPKKIMVFDFAVLDTIDALGVDDIERIGVPLYRLPKKFANYKDKIIDLGGLKDPNIEKIYTFKPDIIFINGRQARLYEELSTIAPTIQISLDYNKYIESSKETMMSIAKIFGKSRVLKKKLVKIDKELKDISKLANQDNKKTLILLTNGARISTFGIGSRFGFLYSDFGLTQCDDRTQPSIHGQLIGYEYISQVNPDIILYVDKTLLVGGDTLGSETLNNELVQGTSAGKNHKIISLDAEVWYFMPGGLNTLDTQMKEVKAAIKS